MAPVAAGSGARDLCGSEGDRAKANHFACDFAGRPIARALTWRAGLASPALRLTINQERRQSKDRRRALRNHWQRNQAYNIAQKLSVPSTIDMLDGLYLFTVSLKEAGDR